MAQSKPPKCDGELRLDAEKMGKEASLFFTTNNFNFFHIVFLHKIHVKRIPGMFFLRYRFTLEECDKASLSSHLIEVVSFYPCQK